MKKAFLFSILALSSLFADDVDFVAAAQTKQTSPQTPMSSSNMMMNVNTLTSARPESENGWYLFADVLYWHVDIGSTDWANVTSTNSGTAGASNHSLNYKWDWGFRVGIGANIDHDMWDTNFYYTWLFCDASNKAGKGGSTIVQDEMGIANSSTTVNSGSTKWDIHFSMFDWELGRGQYVSRSLALRPHMGIKGGWINQNIRTKFRSPTEGVYNEKLKNNFWGVGPSAGVNTMWVLGNAGASNEHRFSLFGDVAGALMYGHFDISNRQTNTSLSNVLVTDLPTKGLNRNLAVPMLQGMFGLYWDTSFNQAKNHFAFKAGYELQYWFRQFQQVRVTNSLMTGAVNTRISDDLALQGVTAEFRFDF